MKDLRAVGLVLTGISLVVLTLMKEQEQLLVIMYTSSANPCSLGVPKIG